MPTHEQAPKLAPPPDDALPASLRQPSREAAELLALLRQRQQPALPRWSREEQAFIDERRTCSQ